MKKLFYLIIGVLLISCQSKQAKLIKEYEERIDEKTSIDLKLKVKELNQVGSSIAKDSFDYYDKSIGYMAWSLKDKYERELRDHEFERKMKEIEYKYESDPEIKKLRKKSIDAMNNVIYWDQNILNDLETKNYRGINDEMNNFLDKKDSFSNHDSIVGNIWECTYTVVNPLMSNAKQTIKAKYCFSPDNEKLVRKIP